MSVSRPGPALSVSASTATHATVPSPHCVLWCVALLATRSVGSACSRDLKYLDILVSEFEVTLVDVGDDACASVGVPCGPVWWSDDPAECECNPIWDVSYESCILTIATKAVVDASEIEEESLLPV